MVSLALDVREFEGIIQQTVNAAIREWEQQRPRDEEGRILLTKREAAKRLGVSEKTLDRWRESEGLPCVKFGSGKPMFRPESLDQWVANRETSSAKGE